MLGLLSSRPGDYWDLLVSVGLFGFSFLILISIWLRYTETMSVLPIETSGTRMLNVLLLFLVAVEPYLFNLIGPGSSLSGDVATDAYALDFGAIYAILASFNHVLTSKGRVLIQRDLVRRYKLGGNLQIGVALIFLTSLFPELYVISIPVGVERVPVRFPVWVVSLFLSRGTWFLQRLGLL